jgi:hypothetical protein
MRFSPPQNIAWYCLPDFSTGFELPKRIVISARSKKVKPEIQQ